jgi:TetR/AcrR family fatty acid metabolism transcriptional regulator
MTDSPEADSTATRKREKHAQILAAAIDVFAEKGFHNARIADVARQAGVADGTIYLYFRNKEELLITIFEEKMGQLISGAVAATARSTDPLEKLRLFAKHHYEQVVAQRTLAEVLQVELRLSNKFLKEYRPEKLWDYLGLIGAFLKEGQERGLVRPDLDPYVLSWAFFGALDELGMQWILQRRPRFSLDSTAETVADVFIRGILVPHPQQETSHLEQQ